MVNTWTLHAILCLISIVSSYGRETFITHIHFPGAANIKELPQTVLQQQNIAPYLPHRNEFPNQIYEPPDETYEPPDETYGPPDQTYGPPDQTYGPPDETYGPPDQPYGPPDESNGTPHETYGPPRPPNQLYKPSEGLPHSSSIIQQNTFLLQKKLKPERITTFRSIRPVRQQTNNRSPAKIVVAAPLKQKINNKRPINLAIQPSRLHSGIISPTTHLTLPNPQYSTPFRQPKVIVGAPAKPTQTLPKGIFRPLTHLTLPSTKYFKNFQQPRVIIGSASNPSEENKLPASPILPETAVLAQLIPRIQKSIYSAGRIIGYSDREQN